MKKILISTILLLSVTNTFSQQSIQDSIIYLEEVVVGQQVNRNNKIIIETKGKNNSTFSVQNESIFVSKIEKIPKGKISSIKFYFNNRKKTNYSNNDFKLRIFKVNSENKPGKEILEKDIRFTINENHKGEIELNLIKLNLLNHEQLYLGLELLNENKILGFSIDCITDKKALSFFRLKNSNDLWIKIPNIKIRTELVVLK